MTLYRLTFFPNGELDSERMNLAEIDSDIVAQFDAIFSEQLSFHGSIPSDSNMMVKWTGMESGQALFTFSFDNKPFLSGVLLAGQNAVADSQILQMFLQSLENVTLIKQLTGGRPNPFHALSGRPERPLLSVVLWPTLTAETLSQLSGLDVLLTAAFLRRISLTT